MYATTTTTVSSRLFFSLQKAPTGSKLSFSFYQKHGRRRRRHYFSNPSSPSPFHLNNVIACNKLLYHHIKAGDIPSALHLFNSMETKTNITWNTILSAYSNSPGKLQEARQLFYTIPKPDTISHNIMLSCYLRNSYIQSALVFFHHLPLKDTISWNSMISGLSRNGMIAEAHHLFQKMPQRNHITWNAIISGYLEAGDFETAESLFSKAPTKCVVTWTAMISGYMKLGKTAMAEKLFQEIPMKDLVTWNCMISGYIDNFRAEDGLKLFKSMINYGLKPNPATFSSVLLGCSILSAITLGKLLHQCAHKSPLQINTTVGTSLVSMYCKCGNLDDAWKLFYEMKRRDVITWNAMISGCAQHGEGSTALRLFDEMKSKGVQPNRTTFIAVLLACTHAGLVQTGLKYFHSMSSHHGIEAGPEHYTCIVDLYGRAGFLLEAVDFIKRMPFPPPTAVFGTLLGACRVHRCKKMAEFAAWGVLRLDQRKATGYVQLANVYAAVGEWGEVRRVRGEMRKRGAVKEVGCSWMEVRGEVHEFRSGERMHKEMEKIKKKLVEVEGRIREKGYEIGVQWALKDVGEKVKEELLWGHSERLAVGYGLVRLGEGCTICVFKNLRVCGDCHEVVKYISMTENRVIIIRDTVRFHHFRDGRCSCGDFW